MKNRFCMKKINTQRGASLLEVVLAMALTIILIPFMYNQIADMNNSFKDISVANKIVKSRDKVINYIRLNQEAFQDEAGTQLRIEELEDIMPTAHTGWVFKTKSKDSEITEVFLAFRMDTDYQTANVAKFIGNDAAIVSTDNVAYSQNWAIGIDDDFGFLPGDLIYRIVHDFGGEDKNKFLHRGTVGDEQLNRMERDLDLNWNDLHNVDEAQGLDNSNLKMHNTQTDFFAVGTDDSHTIFSSIDTSTSHHARTPFVAQNIVFAKGAALKSNDMCFEKLDVSDEVIGFDTISAQSLSSPKQTVTSGSATIPIPATNPFVNKEFSLGQANKESSLGRKGSIWGTDSSENTGSISSTDGSGRIDSEITTGGNESRIPEGTVKVDNDVVLKAAGSKLEFENVDNKCSVYAEYVNTEMLTTGKGGKIVVSNEANTGDVQTDTDKYPYSFVFSGAAWQYPRKSKDEPGTDVPGIQTLYINNMNVRYALKYPVFRDYGKCDDIFEKYRK